MSYFATIREDNPVAAWRLGESSGTTAVDSSGNGNNGTYTGGVTLAQTGALTGDPNTAALFIPGGFLSVPNASALSINGPLTLEAWVKFSSFGSGTSTWVIISKGGGFNVIGNYLLRQDDNNGSPYIAFWVQDATQWEPRASSLGHITLQTGVWYHAVGVYTGSAVQLYINGVLMESNARSAALATNVFNVDIGANATLDEAAIYNYALTAAQVTQHYKAGLAQIQTTLLLQNGNDVTFNMEQATWSIREQLSRRGSTFSFHLKSETYLTVNEFDEFQLIDTQLGQTLFDGMATKGQLYLTGPVLFDWAIQCTDWTFFLDKRHVSGSYGTQRADQIVASLFTNFPCGITQNNVNQAPILQTFYIHHMTFSRALTRLCQFISTSSSNWSWFVDYNRDLHFFDQAQAQQAAFYLSDNLFDTNAKRVWYERPAFYSEFDATDVRTNVVVRGGVATSNVQTDLWVGNGNQKSWQLTYVPYTNSQATDYFTPTLTVGGVSQTVAFDLGISGQTAQFLISPDKLGQYNLVVNTGSVPAASSVIQLQYKYQLPVLQTVPHLGARNKYKSGGAPLKAGHDGNFDVVLEDTRITDAITALQRGLQHLQGYAYAEHRLRVTTTPGDNTAPVSNPNHYFHAGQVVNVTNGQVSPALSSAPYIIYQMLVTGKPGGYRTSQLDLVAVTGS